VKGKLGAVVRRCAEKSLPQPKAGKTAGVKKRATRELIETTCKIGINLLFEKKKVQIQTRMERAKRKISPTCAKTCLKEKKEIRPGWRGERLDRCRRQRRVAGPKDGEDTCFWEKRRTRKIRPAGERHTRRTTVDQIQEEGG